MQFFFTILYYFWYTQQFIRDLTVITLILYLFNKNYHSWWLPVVFLTVIYWILYLFNKDYRQLMATNAFVHYNLLNSSFI